MGVIIVSAIGIAGGFLGACLIATALNDWEDLFK